MRKDVLVLMGGPDAERPVSILSGREVAGALRESGRFNVIEAIIDAPGPEELAELGGDVVFPVLHGQWGEGGALQGALETLCKPFVGSSSYAARLAMDKLKTKAVLSAHGIATPDACELGPHDACPLPPPLVLKPVDDGSSVDIRICHTPHEVDEARRTLHIRRPRLMAEQYIPGREITVGIVNGTLLAPIEIVPNTPFYDYASKYDRDDTRYEVNPSVPAQAVGAMQRAAMTAWEQLGCVDIARADFRLDTDGVAWFLEINTMPGFTTHSLLPMAAAHAGWPMRDLCTMLVEGALARGGSSPGAEGGEIGHPGTSSTSAAGN